MSKTYLYNHTSPETAYVVEDYPWGFRQRTQKRYWVETNDHARGGQRFVSQTLNPKTGQWCNPKKSTYHSVVVMYVDHEGKVSYDTIQYVGMGKEWFKKTHWFLDNHTGKLTPYQLETIHELIRINERISNMKFECFIEKTAAHGV